VSTSSRTTFRNAGSTTNALAATTQELTAELYTLQAEIADLLDALNLGKVLLQRDVPFLPMLDLRPTR
jgi:hypothetical protein